MKKTLLIVLTLINLSQVLAKVVPPATDYYTLAPGGDMTTFIWSKSGHTGTNCSCVPDLCNPDFDIPSNAIIHIAHPVTISCNIVIGSNSTIIIESGGSLTVTGNASISGTGFFQINSGGSATVSGNFSVTGTGDATINGSLTVGGNLTLTGGGGSDICGSGTISVTGIVTGTTDPCFTGLLPIELLYFNAEVNNDRVELRWATASETNNDYFTVERSKEGDLWATVIVVDGAGNSNTMLEYLDFDSHPLNSTSYYRLKQTDYDGNFTYSNIAVVNNQNSNGTNDVVIFPNPNNGNNFNLEFAGFGEEEVLVVVRDIVGREYYSKVYLVNDNSSLFAVSLDENLPVGTYLVIASSKEDIVSKKFVVK